MNMVKMSLLGALALAIAPAIATAQSQPVGYKVSIEIVDANQRGDTATIRYLVRNDASSKGSIETFSMTRPVPLVAASPRATPWALITGFGGRGAIQWVALDSSLWLPGSQGDTLVYSALGVVGLRRAWLDVFEPIPNEADVAEAEATGRPIGQPPLRITTLGIVRPLSSPTVSTELAQLDSLRAVSCSSGWISSQGVCNSIRQKLSAATASIGRNDLPAAKSQLGALLNELDAQRNKHVSNLAYWLIRTNAQRIVSHY